MQAPDPLLWLQKPFVVLWAARMDLTAAFVSFYLLIWQCTRTIAHKASLEFLRSASRHSGCHGTDPQSTAPLGSFWFPDVGQSRPRVSHCSIDGYVNMMNGT